MNRKIDPSQLWLIAIKDKDLADEPFIAFGVFEAASSEAAIRATEPTLDELREAGRCRCVPVVLGAESLPFQLSRFYAIRSGTAALFNRKIDALRPLPPNTTCVHTKATRGKDAPRMWGSYQTEVCDACKMFRYLTHHGEITSQWYPAAEYEAAVAPRDDD